MATSPLVAVVTGSSRGIGQAIVALLAKSHTPLLIYATSREGSALDIQPDSGNEIRYAKLDISDEASIDNLAQKLDRVDILINNAGINLDEDYNYENAKRTFDVNYFGTKRACLRFIPKMPANGKSRIVNVTSGACQLGNYAPAIQTRFRSSSMTMSELDNMATEFLDVVERHDEKQSGWYHEKASYSVSKSCVTALTAILARENPDILINCCCPGWVHTDMGQQVGQGGKTPQEGAKIPVKLAIGDIANVTGRYWANDDKESTNDGKVQDW